MDVFDLFARISLDDSEYVRGLNGAEGKAAAIGGKLAKGLGNAAKITAKAITAATAAGVAGAVALVKNATEAYASYEQLVGGVETLFKDSAGKVVQYANDAYKTAGLSANDYMETVTSFSASLLQSLGGDTDKAADYADKAITDMSDNANKMGSSMESIQNAYQGFAKQNYTMLDNLKLGYGGTKEEMQRLLKDAQKISGIKYDISSYADVVSAIHEVQQSLDISGISIEEYNKIVASGEMTQEEAFKLLGTTAKEAATTIEGSVNTAKAAWTNLVTGLGDKNADLSGLIDTFVGSVSTAFNNILPVAENALSGITTMINKILPVAAAEIPKIISETLPSLVDTGVQVVEALVKGIKDSSGALGDSAFEVVGTLVGAITKLVPEIFDTGFMLLEQFLEGILANTDAMIETATDMMQSFIDMFSERLPEIIYLGVEVVSTLAAGIAQALPELIPATVQLISGLVTNLLSSENIQMIIDCALQLVLGLVDGLLQAAPVLVESLPTIITGIVDGLLSSVDDIVLAGVELFTSLAEDMPGIIDGICNSIPEIIDGVIDSLLNNSDSIAAAGVKLLGALIKNAPKIIATAVTIVPRMVFAMQKALISKVPDMAKKGVELLKGFVDGAKNMIPKVKETFTNVGTKVIDTFKNLPSKMLDIGKNLVQGLWKGITNAKDWIIGKIKSFSDDVLDGIKGFFGVHSPSKKTEWVGEMLGEGLGLGWEKSSKEVMNGINKDLSFNVKTAVNGAGNTTSEAITNRAELGEIIASAVSSALNSYEIEWNDRNLGRMVRKYV